MSISKSYLNSIAVIDVTVQPKSSRSEIVFKENNIKVFLFSPPSDGKANEECIELFSKRLRIAKSYIEIDKGQKGRKKRILVKGISTADAINILKKGLTI